MLCLQIAKLEYAVNSVPNVENTGLQLRLGAAGVKIKIFKNLYVMELKEMFLEYCRFKPPCIGDIRLCFYDQRTREFWSGRLKFSWNQQPC